MQAFNEQSHLKENFQLVILIKDLNYFTLCYKNTSILQNTAFTTYLLSIPTHSKNAVGICKVII